MKKFYLGIIYILPFITFAQSPCTETQVILSSQADVDNFPSMYSCSTLCSLTIQGNDITNLDSLSTLQHVGELLMSFNPTLTNINGLSNISSIGGSCYRSGLTIEWNNSLSDLNGLSSLAVIHGPVIIAGNTMLSDVNGLSQVTSVDALDISRNASLLDVNGLSGLTTIVGNLIISGNPGLYDINGLSHLSAIAGNVSIDLNDVLATLDGFSAVSRINGMLSITYNYDLASIAGLSNLNHVGQFTPSGTGVEIMFNDDLASLNGLQGLDTIPGVLTIEGNGSLTDLDGLSSLVSLDVPVGGSYNSGIRVANNNSLTDISAISAIEEISDGRVSFFELEGNAALTEINPLALKVVVGSIGTRLIIRRNNSLVDLDGLSLLERVSSGITAVVEISDNPSLQNIDGLSNLGTLSSTRGGILTIADNTTLGSFCGLYTLIKSRGINCGTPSCYSTDNVTIEGNERNPTPEQIEEEGPCGAVVTQPTNIMFSQITAEGMRARFNPATGFASGYVVLMKSYGPSAPDDVPQDGQTYHVGQVIGSSSIVVHMSSDTTFVVSGLEPSTPYYFSVFSYKTGENGKDYLIVNPLVGRETTNEQAPFVSTLSFTEVSDESMTVIVNEPEPGNYIALMKAFGYPSPGDIPNDGTEYHVGNTVGSSTIVVNIGDGSAFTVNGLEPNITYYFDVYRYDANTFVYEPAPARGSQKTSQSGENLRPYPNPFDVATSIPFVVSTAQEVQVAIYDSMGHEVNVLTSDSYDVGQHAASWDGYDKNGRKMSSGIYIYSIKTGDDTVTGRISLR